jgi:hypothetical protein
VEYIFLHNLHTKRKKSSQNFMVKFISLHRAGKNLPGGQITILLLVWLLLKDSDQVFHCQPLQVARCVSALQILAEGQQFDQLWATPRIQLVE